MALDLEKTFLLTRRDTVACGGIVATAAAMLTARLSILPAEAKKRKKRKKKKPPQTVAQFVAASMTGAKEVPSNTGDPNAAGNATFVIKSNGQICCDFTVTALSQGSTVSLTHIHRGGAGEEPANNIVVDFQGQLENCVSPGQAILDEIIANPAGFYANLHTNLFSAGAMRDQLAAV